MWKIMIEGRGDEADISFKKSNHKELKENVA